MKNRPRSLRALALLLCAVLLICCFSGCKKNKKEPMAEAQQSAAPTGEAVQTKEEEKKPLTDYNRLTGLDDLSNKAKGKRPVAIMINNIKASLPQYGIAGADLMFECIVEGGITRMMAVFADYTKIPDVCSVRSCRYYFPILAQGLNAYYICFGCNPTLGKNALEKTRIDYIDGNEDYDQLIFGRDPERLKRYSREHTAFVKGGSLPQFFKERGINMNYAPGKDDYIFNFRKPKAVSDQACESVRLNFSKSYYTTFSYDSDSKVYLKTHCGNRHMDTAANKQLQYTNVIILETDVELVNGGPLVKYGWQGTGYYLSYGTVRKITWIKKSYDDPLLLMNENGKEIQINEGTSYIGMLGYNSTVF
ncbi:MAG: DUF3048 domain-containing protein [Clostridia bacterium]|nr:DUF3048 domain-containing protein [Clostridia bacterium]